VVDNVVTNRPDHQGRAAGDGDAFRELTEHTPSRANWCTATGCSGPSRTAEDALQDTAGWAGLAGPRWIRGALPSIRSWLYRNRHQPVPRYAFRSAKRTGPAKEWTSRQLTRQSPLGSAKSPGL